MRISDIMTHEVETITPDQSIAEAARTMLKSDCGSLFVRDNDKLVGVITDRDIVIRCVAKDLPCDTPVSQIMTDAILYCFEDEDIQHVAENMADLHVRRLPVMNRNKRLVGIVSLGNFASGANVNAGSTLLRGVAQAH
ncbi:CBS domain-containing protein [Saccharophagus sp. K07]|uniref:CBS domain-containing protein n=1 Tax=Saccharophagus sp. K07 TaxID=2283636 RepID=UPI0016521FDC|nr:CBS domain-containing protein [Saccharophagus sp. K07]MBC6905414.1 CBS domain-containing protein [Saccharophagus sp. K07]